MSIFSTLTEIPTDKILAAISTQPDRPLQEFVDELTESKLTEYASCFMNLSPKQIADSLTAKTKKVRSKVEVPSVEGFKDDTREAFKTEVRELVDSTGMGEGVGARGLRPMDIRKGLGRGSENQLREILKELESDKAVAFAGVTKSKKYVPFKMRKAAEQIYQAEKAARLKLQAEKDAKKAKEAK